MSLTKMQGVINSGTVPTISSYLRILDDTMLIKPLQKYDNSIIKTRNSIPKLQVYNNAFRNSYCQHTFEEALMNKAEWGRLTASNFYFGETRKKRVRLCLKKGECLIAIEVKSGHADNISGYLAFKNKFRKDIVNSFIVGPESLPLEDFFKLNIPLLFKKPL